MDSLAHALYGATCFSRTGFAGGLNPCETRKVLADWTVWASAAFGLLPDALSIGVHFTKIALSGSWHHVLPLPPYAMELYQVTHSLFMAAMALLVLARLSRPLMICALAWPLHILCDALLHGVGIFQTPLFYPISSFRITGINWWQHPWIIYTYWALLPVLWAFLHFKRRAQPEYRS